MATINVYNVDRVATGWGSGFSGTNQEDAIEVAADGAIAVTAGDDFANSGRTVLLHEAAAASTTFTLVDSTCTDGNVSVVSPANAGSIMVFGPFPTGRFGTSASYTAAVPGGSIAALEIGT